MAVPGPRSAKCKESSKITVNIYSVEEEVELSVAGLLINIINRYLNSLVKLRLLTHKVNLKGIRLLQVEEEIKILHIARLTTLTTKSAFLMVSN